MASLSLVTNTFNEESNLRALFYCVADIVDEIIVVDTGSTDNTRELARKLGARVYEMGGVASTIDGTTYGPGYGPMRTLTHDLARTDWTLLLDGDERMLPQDTSKIPSLIANPDLDMIWLPRHHYQDWGMTICENPDLRIHPDWQARLKRNDRKAFWVRKVHEQLHGVDTKRETRDIGSPIIRHFGFLKTPERLQFIVDVCNKLHKSDQLFAETYTLENQAGTANGPAYWSAVETNAYVKS